MSRIPLATDLKTRTGAPSTKDARQVNSYLETKGEQTAVRKRPSAQGGILVGTGTAQGGIGLTIGGVPTFIGFWGDTIHTYTGSGTSWSSGASYLTGDHVAVNFVDYWAINNNTNSQPPSANWSRTYVPAAPPNPFVWISRTLSSNQPWIDIAWNGTVFCAIAQSVCTTSPDGITWTEHNLPNNRNWTAIAWNGTVFCAITYDITGKGVSATSTDGITWSEHLTAFTGCDWNKIAWNGTTFCVVGNSGYAKTWTSTDGITWTANSTPTLPALGNQWTGISWNGSLYCVVHSGGQIYTSPDALTWTNRSPVWADNWSAVIWNGTIFCVTTARTNNTESNVFATSPDGINWTQRTLSLSGLWYAVGWNGVNICIVGMDHAYNSMSLTSPDGITWTSRSIPTSQAWHAIAWNGSVFCTISYATPLGLGSSVAATAAMR